jgi:hypothetical protein
MKQLFPDVLNNDYKGNRISLYFFYAITCVTLLRSLIHVFSPDGGAQSIATIPLDLYDDNAAHAIIHLFSEWGLSQLLFGLFYMLVLFKYKSLIPLMYVFLLLEYTARLLLGFYKPIELIGHAPGGIANYFLVPLLAIMFFLSIQRNQNA